VKPIANGLDGQADGARGEVQEIHDELVGVLGRKAVGSESGVREVAKIGGDDHAGLASDRSRHDVPVIRVRKLDPVDECLVSGDEAVGSGTIHLLAHALERCGLDVWPVPEQASHPFPVDLGGPTGTEQSRRRELQKDVPQRCGIEDAPIEDRGESAVHDESANQRRLRQLLEPQLLIEV
jgi:hypothetical protein